MENNISELFDREPDLVFFKRLNKNDSTVISVPNSNNVVSNVAQTNLYSTLDCEPDQVIGFFLGERAFVTSYRISYLTYFFNKETSNIDGGLNVFLPTTNFTPDGTISSNQVVKIVSGFGDFIGAEGYLFLQPYGKIIKYSVYFTQKFI